MGGAPFLRPGTAELINHASVPAHREAALGEGRPEAISAQPIERGPEDDEVSSSPVL